MGLMDIIRRRGPMNGSANYTGIMRMGGNTYQADGWVFQRIANSVFRNPTGYRCVNAFANNFSRPDFIVRATDTDNDERLHDHPALEVFNKPGPRMPGTEWLRAIAFDKLLTGKHVALRVYGPDGLGTRGSDPLSGFRRLAPQRTTIIGNQDDEWVGVIYSDLNGRRALALPDDVLYLRFPHPERWYDAMAPAIVAGLPAETDSQATRHNFDLLANDGGVPGYISVSGLSTEDFLEWKRLWEAGEVAGKMRFLGGDGSMTLAKVGMTNQELVHDKIVGLAQRDIMKAFGAYPAVIGESGENYSNVEPEKVLYIQQTIDPEWISWRDDMTLQIMDTEYKGDPGVSDFDKLMIAELNESEEAVHKRDIDRIDRGMIPRSEWRQKNGLPAIEGDDVLIFQPGVQFGSKDGLPVEASEEMGDIKLDTAKSGAELAAAGGAAALPPGSGRSTPPNKTDKSQRTSSREKGDGSPSSGFQAKPRSPVHRARPSGPNKGASGTPSGGRKALESVVDAEGLVVDRTLERMRRVLIARVREKGQKALTVDEDRWSRELRDDGVSGPRTAEVIVELQETFYGAPDMDTPELIEWIERSVRR